MSALTSLMASAQNRPGAEQPRAERARGIKSWLPRKELIGVDIGSSRIKAVLLSHRRGAVSLNQAVVAPTPDDVVTAGKITNAIRVAAALRKLCKDSRLGARSIAVAVSGEKVYTQFEVLPTEFSEDLDAYVQEAILKVIPYALDRASFDYQAADQKQAGRGVLWASSGSEQVEWLREAVTLAGKIPAIVDVQACALANAYSFNYRPDSSEVVLLLHAGPRQMTVALMRGSQLLCSRDMMLQRDSSGPEQVDLAAAAIDGLSQRWEFWLEKSSPDFPQRIYLSGAAAGSVELHGALRETSELAVDVLDPFRSISYSPASAAGKVVVENGANLAIAAGLALRNFEEL